MYKNLETEGVLNLFLEPILIIDSLGIIRFANEAFLDMIGHEREDIIDENILHFLQDDSIFEQCMSILKKSGKCINNETNFLHKNRTIVPTIKTVKMIDIDGENCLFVNLRNISKIDIMNKKLSSRQAIAESKTAQLKSEVDSKEKELKYSQMRLNEVLSSINEIIWYIDDTSFQVLYVNDAVENIFEIKKNDFMANPILWQSMVHPEDSKKLEALFVNLQKGETESIEFRIVRADGSLRWLNSRITRHQEESIFIGVSFDITDNKTTQDQIEFLAYHDILTKLPNRAYLKKEIELMLERSKVIQQTMAVLFLDLDNFKYINDTLGHEVGDEVLISVAKRLSEAVRSSGICTRFGGDEFIILLNNVDENDIKVLANRILARLTDPFIIRDNEFFISCSIGVSLFPAHADASSSLIKHADTAMYEAKNGGKNRFVVYNKEMDKHSQEFLELENLIRDAISNNYFKVFFQPLVNAATLKVEGFEALLRFFHPKIGSIAPDRFIPVAEATGDIIKISEMVMSEACKFAKEINAINEENDSFVNVNVSARQFTDTSFSQEFIRCLQKNEVDPNNIKVELTESSIMSNVELASVQLKELKEAGIKTALDDFGTGYSSFSYLAQLPIDVLKIDKSFVINLFEVKENQHIIEAVSTMAKAMEMSVVAEGVESLEHAEYLQKNGVDILQGFLISKALSPEEIKEMKRNKTGFFSESLHTCSNVTI